MTRVRRGMMRLWAAITLIWLIIIGVTYANHVIDGNDSEIWVYVAQEKQFRPADGVNAYNLADVKKKWDARAIETNADRAVLLISNTVPESETKSIALQFVSKRWSRRGTRFLDSAPIAFVPPIVLLLFGMLVAWIVRGFRSDG